MLWFFWFQSLHYALFALKTITAQASRYPRIIPGSPAITGTLSSGASASPQYRSAVNVPLTNMMHHQGMRITVTMLAVAQCSAVFYRYILYST